MQRIQPLSAAIKLKRSQFKPHYAVSQAEGPNPNQIFKRTLFQITTRQVYRENAWYFMSSNQINQLVTSTKKELVSKQIYTH